MPEAPDLEVIREYLAGRAVGSQIAAARVIKPSVLRPLAGDLSSDADGRTLDAVGRRGKWLILDLSGGRVLAINPMLSGAFQYCCPDDRLFKRTCIVLPLSNGHDLRYLDDRQMGMVYYVREDQMEQVPRLSEQGPDVLDDFSFESFQHESPAVPRRDQGGAHTWAGHSRLRQRLLG